MSDLESPTSAGTHPGINMNLPRPPITEKLQRDYWLAIKASLERAMQALVLANQDAEGWRKDAERLATALRRGATTLESAAALNTHDLRTNGSE